MEAERLVANHTAVEFEATELQPLAASRMAAVQYRHVVSCGHLVDGGEERAEIRLRVDVLLAVGGEQDVSSLLETKPRMYVAGLYLR